MRKVVLAVALAGAFLAGSLLTEGLRSRADEKPEPKIRPALYQKWGQLGLSEEQRQKIYRIQIEHRTKIKELEDQIDKLKSEELSKSKEVLTPAQTQKLRELLLGEPSKDATPPAKDKPATDKPSVAPKDR